MKKLVLAAFAASTLLASGTALAKAPNGTFVFKDNQDYDQRCLVGAYSSQIIQNGQFVGGSDDTPIDQTTSPGSRADAVHAIIDSCRANGQD